MSSSEEPSVEEGRRFAGNTAWVFAGQLGSKMAGFVFFVIVARVLGVREYGYFNFAASFVPLFLAFGTLGLDSITVRELAKHPSRTSEILASALVTRVVAGGAGLLASLGVGLLFADNVTAYATLAFVGLALLVDEIASLYTSVFRAYERMNFNAFVKTSNRAVSTLLALVALVLGGELTHVVLAYLLGSLAALGYAAWIMHRHFPPTRISDARRDVIMELFREGRALGLAGIFNLALFRIDAVMVEAIRGATAVGFYGVAYRFFESFLFVAFSLMTVGLPRIAKQGTGEAARRTFELVLSLGLAFYLPIALGTPFVDEWLVTNLFGDRYASAAEAVPWLTGAAVFYGIAFVARMTVIGLGETRAIARVAVVALTTNVALNLYLIPTEGFVGAAIATFVAEVIEAVLTLLALRRMGVECFRVPLAGVPALAAGVMCALLLVTRAADLSALLLGAAVYLLGLVVSARILAPEKTRRALRMLKKQDT